MRLTLSLSLSLCASLLAMPREADAADTAFDSSDNLKIFSGTAEDDIPASVAMRNWGFQDEVFFVYERFEHPDLGSDEDRRLYVKGYTCSDDDVCATQSADWAETQIGTLLRFNQGIQPAVAIRRSGGKTILHIAARQMIYGNCDQDFVAYDEEEDEDDDSIKNVDLAEIVWDTDDGEGSTRAIDKNDAISGCEDRGIPSIKYRSSQPYACWTGKPINNADEEIRCGTRSTGGDWDAYGAINNSGFNNEHATFTFDTTTGTDRFVAYTKRNGAGASSYRIKGTFADRANDPTVTFAGDNNDKVDFPTTMLRDDMLYLAWAEDFNNSTATIEISECDTVADDCEDVGGGEWTTTEVAAVSEAKHPEIRSDGDRQFVIFEADYEYDTNLFARRIYFTERCVGSGWTTPVVIREPDTSSWHQGINLGRIHLALNRQENLVHVAWVEWELGMGGVPDDGDIWWAWAEYDDCS